ncbi:glutaminyl-peptide cyclotransferase-like protein [Punctularia strigosozonata HHB-11173 SS5]|uniref:glutaminyl-peptide cyclotransferase-like protein n=1 Tax=Punctularia strigosozonata (strain HHB-11173) TaxID=741275 RepID=UPI0004417026|nr:glutaminyl-peptide cyclotransferase-like protein [Punctularia strigosozonata HHB-11173 SS5]EIN07213.1 glutaminyl-peptide cyclotransferase-like protein [Punctularia strigosozonata HHB-11173 SS5]
MPASRSKHAPGSSVTTAWLNLVLLSTVLILSLVQPSYGRSTLGERALTQLSASDISSLVSSPDPAKNVDISNSKSHLSKILIPRPPDTANNTIVKDYIVKTLRKLKWDVEEDSFNDTTPYGVKRFTNIIATKDPSAPRRVILAAHFDSKFFPTSPQNQFVGATDSAAPCAMMLDLAESLNSLLDHRAKQLEDGLADNDDMAETTLQLVFFDGEEAFKEWTKTDSVYGARHLAAKWASTYINPNTKRRLLSSVATEISTIEHLILLDLLGAPNPVIQSFFKETAWLFDAMASAEQRLRDSDAFKGEDNWHSFFKQRTGNEFGGFIEDDHIPFLKEGVDVLHIIASPFPRVWHTLQDDASALDLPTMRRWNLILRVFMSEYLGLKPDAHGRRSRASEDLTS